MNKTTQQLTPLCVSLYLLAESRALCSDTLSLRVQKLQVQCPALTDNLYHLAESRGLCSDILSLSMQVCRYSDLLSRTTFLEDRAEDFQLWQEKFVQNSEEAMATLHKLQSQMEETR
jgi:hypothetical protein